MYRTVRPDGGDMSTVKLDPTPPIFNADDGNGGMGTYSTRTRTLLAVRTNVT